VIAQKEIQEKIKQLLTRLSEKIKTSGALHNGTI
jgi:hypothetical protein